MCKSKFILAKITATSAIHEKNMNIFFFCANIFFRQKHQFIDYFLYLQLLLLAMKDMNIAKLTSVDLPLFNGIVSDLFPGVDTPAIDYSKVNKTPQNNLKLLVQLGK